MMEKIIAVVTEEARLVLKYECVRYSVLEITLLARRFAPCSASPLLPQDFQVIFPICSHW